MKRVGSGSKWLPGTRSRGIAVGALAFTFSLAALAFPQIAGGPRALVTATTTAEPAECDNPDLRLGRSAFERGDFVAAQQDLRRALSELRDVRSRREAQSMLAVSAFRSGDFRTTIATLEGRVRGEGARDELVLLANAYVESGDYDRGMALLGTLQARYPDDPTPQYWMVRHESQRQRAAR